MEFFPLILKEVNYLRGLNTDGKIMDNVKMDLKTYRMWGYELVSNRLRI